MDFDATVAPLLARFSIGPTVIPFFTSVFNLSLAFSDSDYSLCEIFSDAKV